MGSDLTQPEFKRQKQNDKKQNGIRRRKIKGDTGTIQGTLTAKDGTTVPLEYKFIKENNEWKILSIDLSGTAGTNPNENSANGMKIFSDAKLGYSIQYPQDWDMEKKDNVTVLFSGPKEKKIDDVTINIQNLQSASRGGKYADTGDVIKDLKSQIRSIDKNATFSDIPDIIFKRTDGMEITAKGFAMKFTQQSQKYAIMQVIIPHGDNLTFHAFGYTAPLDKFQNNLDLAKSILETWQIQK